METGLGLPQQQRPGAETWIGVGLLLLFLVGGLLYVKWDPSFHKAFVAARQHSIGASIVTGTSAAAPPVGWHAAWSYTVAYGKDIWSAILLGLILGSGVQAVLPRAWLMRVLGGRQYKPTVVAGLAAVPSMMCTCCSAPIAVGLTNGGAGVGSVLAYWLGNPVLNPATLIFIGFVLGWRWVALRVVVGLLLVFGIAPLAGRLLRPEDLPRPALASHRRAATAPEDTRSLAVRWISGFGKLALGLIPEYAVVVVLLGAVRAWLFPVMNPAIGHSLWLVGLLAVAGTLFVIPTAGEVPIIQTMTRFGLGAAGAGVLLITLPAVSLPSLLMVGRAISARVLVFVACSVAVLGLVSGAAAWALHL